MQCLIPPVTHFLLFFSAYYIWIVRVRCNINTCGDYKRWKLPHFWRRITFSKCKCEQLMPPPRCCWWTNSHQTRQRKFGICLNFFTLCWFLFMKCRSLELKADCVTETRDVSLLAFFVLSRPLSPTLSLHFRVRSATTLPFFCSTKANCSSVFLALFHPSVFSLFLSVSFCPFHNNKNHRFCLFLRSLCLFLIGCLSEQARLVPLVRSHLIRQEKRSRWRLCCHTTGANVFQFNFLIWSRQTAVYIRNT